MTINNARVLYKHRLELGKKVDDILNLYPELANEETQNTTPEVSQEPTPKTPQLPLDNSEAKGDLKKKPKRKR